MAHKLILALALVLVAVRAMNCALVTKHGYRPSNWMASVRFVRPLETLKEIMLLVVEPVDEPGREAIDLPHEITL